MIINVQSIRDIEKLVLNLFFETMKVQISEQLECNYDTYVKERELTGVGFYTSYVNSSLLNLSNRSDSFKYTNIVGNTFTMGKDIESDIGFVVYIEKGYLVLLEGFTYFEYWPELISKIAIKKIDWNESVREF